MTEGRTIIVCRDAQWREAAIVLSCVDGGSAPLVIIDPPPISEAAYRVQHEAYRPARARLQMLSGAVLAPGERREDLQALARLDVDRATDAMTPYRAWWRLQRTIAGIVPSLDCNQALILFAPSPEDLDPTGAFSDGAIGPARFATLPDTVARVVLAPPLHELADHAWRSLRGDAPVPEDLLVERDTPQAWLGALADALRTGRRLRPGPGGSTKRRSRRAPPAPAREAVLVEAAPRAAAVMGVQHAHLRQARLTIVPPIDVAPIRKAVDAIAGLVEGARGTGWDARLATATRRLEARVRVPQKAVAAIGDLPLTAFTAGAPYNFMRIGGADWAGKPIGHVVGNPTFQVLSERYGKREPGLDFIFDPGLIDTAETARIEAVIRAAGRSPLTLTGLATLPTTLMVLASAPVDLLYFNTHGSDTSIKLGFAELETPGFKLIRGGLANAPIVFNNSCLSWAGVGREFLLMGARGYVGTLWSVEQEAASGYAEAVLRQAWAHDQPIAAAMRGSATSSDIGRAYMFMGLVDARLAGKLPPARARREAPARLRTVMGLLEYLVATPGPAPVVDHAVNALLVHEKTRLARLASKALSEAERLELHVRDTRLVCLVVAKRSPEQIPLASERVGETLAALSASALPPARRQDLELWLLRALGEAQLAANQPEAAIATLERAVAVARARGLGACDCLLLICDAWRRRDRSVEAAAAAKAAWQEAAREPDPPAARLLALGRLTQLETAAGRPKRALRYARLGQKLAERAQLVGEQAVFKGDETRALMSLHQWPEALEAARAFLALSRHPAVFGTEAELNATGLLGQCLNNLGRLADARDAVETGLRAARQAGKAGSVADFLMDRAALSASDRAGTVRDITEAAEIFAALRSMRKLWKALGDRTDVLNRMHADRDPNFQAAALTAIASCLKFLPLASEELRSMMVRDLADRLLLLLKPRPETPLDELLESAAAGELAMKDAVAHGDKALGACFAVMVAFLRIAHALSAGRAELADMIARSTDEMVGTGGALIGFVRAAADELAPAGAEGG